MVNSCLKCGRDNEKEKDVTLLQVPIEGKSAKWQMELLERLEIQDFTDKNIYICNNHFLPEDFEMKNSMLQLKENALPFRDDAEEDFEEQLEIRPELVFFKSESDGAEIIADSMSDTSETKEFVPLEPLVEYTNVYDDIKEEVELSSDVKYEVEDSEAQMQEQVIIESEYITDNNGDQISVVSSDASNLGVEPVMPFFLTSSPMFTIVNENNEVGETIILQIEETIEKRLPPPVKEVLEELQQSLCKSPTGSITTTYTCDICDVSYGCLNCLKSHYETSHIFNAIRRYKCQFSHHVSKILVCPVCELTFPSRTETMDHYITHSVACEICGSGFDRHAYLTEHYKTVHNRKEHQSVYECELCNMSYQYAATLTKHYRTFHRMTLCFICKKRFTTVGELQEHEKVHQEKLNVLPFACSKCDKAFPKISDIAVHIRHDHKKESILEGESEIVISGPSKAKNADYMPVQKKVKVKK